MESSLALLKTWLPEILIGATAASLGLALVSALLVPALLVRIPVDYFLVAPQPLRVRLRGSTWPRRLGLIAKNLAGAVLALLGILMLLTPGQGVLTLLVGLALLDLPGKRALERRILARPTVRRVVDGLRRRFDQPPLRLPEP